MLSFSTIRTHDANSILQTPGDLLQLTDTHLVLYHWGNMCLGRFATERDGLLL
jgi:hypothetical protein